MHTTHSNTQYKNQSKHSEMGPGRQNPIQRTVSLFICVCIALCTIVAQNTAQNRPDNFPPYPPDNHHSSDDVYLREGDSTTYVDAAYCYRPSSVVCRSVTLVSLSPAKTAEPIEMSFGLRSRVGPGNHGKGQFWGEKGSPF